MSTEISAKSAISLTLARRQLELTYLTVEKKMSAWVVAVPIVYRGQVIMMYKLQVVAGLDFTATGCSCGRRKNTQHNVYLELMHESMMFRNSSCRSAAPDGAACEPQQLPESQPRSPRLHTCPISVSLACFPAGKPARTSGAGYSSCGHGARPTHSYYQHTPAKR